MSIYHKIIIKHLLLWLAQSPFFLYSQTGICINQSHQSNVTHLCLSENGKLLASASRDRVIKIWDINTGLMLQQLEGHKDDIVGLALKDRKLYAAGRDSAIYVWDLIEGALSDKISLPDMVTSMAYLSESDRLLVGLWFDLKQGGRVIQVYLDDTRVPTIHKVFPASTVRTIAYTPSKNMIAFGGSSGTISIWDEELNAEVKSTKAHSTRVSALSFSPQGDRLVSGCSDKSLIVWEFPGMKKISQQNRHINPVTSIAVSGQDGIFASGEGHTNYLPKRRQFYSPLLISHLSNGQLTKEITAHDDYISSLSFLPPPANQLLTGTYSGTIRLVDWHTDQTIRSYEGPFAPLWSVTYDSIRKRILAGNWDGQVYSFGLERLQLTPLGTPPQSPNTMVGAIELGRQSIYYIQGRKIVKTSRNGASTVQAAYHPDMLQPTQLSVSPSERFLAAADRISNVYVFDRNIPLTAIQGATQCAFIDDQQLLTVKTRELEVWGIPDFEKIRSYAYPEHLSVRCMAHHSPSKIVALAGTDGDFSRSPRIFGYLLQLGTGQLTELNGARSMIQTIAFTPNGKHLLGGDDKGNLYIWDTKTGQLVHRALVHGVPVFGISPIGNHHFCSAGKDGSLKYWSIHKGILSGSMLFKDDDNWLAATAEGYYRSTKSVNPFLGFKKQLNSFEFEQFDLRLNRPDKVLENLIPFGADTSLIRQYHQAYHKRLEKYGFTEDMLSEDYHVPECAITNSDQLPISTSERTIKLKIEALDTLRLLDRLNVYVNDVPIYGITGINLRQENTKEYTTSLSLPLSRGKNKIQVSALNQSGAESLKATTYITYDAPDQKPNLYLITIGVSDYQAEGKDLQFAAKDAQDIAEYYQNTTAFDEVYIKTLTNKQVNKANILALRQWLESTTEDDQVLLYVSGHGLLDNNYDFYYATHDTDFANPSEKGILYDEIEGLLDGIPARKKLLLMDACHSGEYDKDAPSLTQAQQDSLAAKGVSFQGFAKGDEESAPILGLQNSFELMQQLFADLRRGSGATVISSSSGVQVSYEDEDWSNGAFTYAFLYGLKSMKADANKDGNVTTSEIQAFVAEYVPRLTEGLQVPTFRRENLEFDFRVW